MSAENSATCQARKPSGLAVRSANALRGPHAAAADAVPVMVVRDMWRRPHQNEDHNPSRPFLLRLLQNSVTDMSACNCTGDSKRDVLHFVVKDRSHCNAKLLGIAHISNVLATSGDYEYLHSVHT